MNFDYREIIPADFHDTSRVWIYQSTRLFSISEAFQVEDILNDFVTDWQSHGTPVKGYANLLYGQFILLMADETTAGVSGCSTDSSVHVIKQIEQQLKVDMFNRQLLAFLIKDKVQLLPMAQLNYALEKNHVNADTLYFNNLVADKQQLLNNWIIPISKSWLATKLKTLQH